MYITSVKQNKKKRTHSAQIALGCRFCFTLDVQGLAHFITIKKSKAMSKQNEEKESGIMVFKSTFDYLIQGDLSNDDFCTLMKCIYDARWNGVSANEEDLPILVRVIWRSLKHSVRKSVRNADNYQNRQKSKEVENNNTHEELTKGEQLINELRKK